MAESQNGLKATRRALYVVTLWVEPGAGPTFVWRDPAPDSSKSKAGIAEKEKLP
jgi:hypothetical protein